MSDNTTTSTARCIDRRTLLSGLSGGLAALAGCSDSTGASNNTDGTPASSPSSETEVLESVTFEGKSGYGARIIAKVELTEDSKITQVGLINGKGNEVHRALISERETVAEFVVARPGDDPSERITQGENILVLVGKDTEIEVPLTYSAALEIRDVVGPEENSELSDMGEWRRDPIGLRVENRATHPEFVQSVISQDGPHMENYGTKTSEYDLGSMVKPNETELLPVRKYLVQNYTCEESHTRQATFTIKSAFSDPVSFTQTFSYSPKEENFCKIGLQGEQTTVEQHLTATSTESK